MKKHIILVLLLCLIAMIIVGCGGSRRSHSDPSPSPSPTPSPMPRTGYMWDMDARDFDQFSDEGNVAEFAIDWDIHKSDDNSSLKIAAISTGECKVKATLNTKLDEWQNSTSVTLSLYIPTGTTIKGVKLFTNPWTDITDQIDVSGLSKNTWQQVVIPIKQYMKSGVPSGNDVTGSTQVIFCFVDVTGGPIYVNGLTPTLATPPTGYLWGMNSADFSLFVREGNIDPGNLLLDTGIHRTGQSASIKIIPTSTTGETKIKTPIISAKRLTDWQGCNTVTLQLYIPTGTTIKGVKLFTNPWTDITDQIDVSGLSKDTWHQVVITLKDSMKTATFVDKNLEVVFGFVDANGPFYVNGLAQ